MVCRLKISGAQIVMLFISVRKFTRIKGLETVPFQIFLESYRENNNAIAEAGMEKAGIGTILNYMLSVGGFLPGAGTAFSIAGLFTQILNDLGIKEKKTIARIENGTASEKDKIFLLDKVNRVAHLERSSF